jgi:hypothetical protein
MALYFLPLFFFFISCSVQKVALRASTPVFEKSANGIMGEGNWDFFKDSSPGNLKFMELLWEQDQDNTALLPVLSKSYAGYSFGVAETLYLEDELNNIENSFWRTQAITFYTRSLDYGLLYLEMKNLTKKDLLGLDPETLKAKLKVFEKEDATALLYTAQSWGSLINLQKDNVALISHVPKVKLLFDRVCELQPDIDANACDFFYAQYESSRPKMLGGDPQKGERLFIEAIKKYPENLLLRVNYIQYVIIPQMDLDKYEKQAVFLRQEFAILENLNRDNLENASPYKNYKGLNLFNSIAKKRFFIIEKFKNKIF